MESNTTCNVAPLPFMARCSRRLRRCSGLLLTGLVLSGWTSAIPRASAQTPSPVQILSWQRAGANDLLVVFRDTAVTNIGYELMSSPALGAGASWTWLSNAVVTPLGGGRYQAQAGPVGAGSVFLRVFAFGPDRDSDGLLSALEGSAYTVTVRQGNGTDVLRSATSDPRLADTDGDGLSDFVERLLTTDPRSADTDGDLLTDKEEQEVYLSNPLWLDTDSDSGGSPLLYDGSELFFYGTSPRLPDTDGDNISDRDEILGNTTNPLVSEVPKPFIIIDDDTVDIRLNVTYSAEQGGASNFSARLSQANTSGLSRSDAVANQISVEASLSVTAGVEATAGLPPSASVSASATASVTAGYTRQNTTTFDSSSSQTAQREYEEYLSHTFNRSETSSSGRLSVNVTIRNEGTVSFQMSNLSLAALKRNPANPTNLQTVATLTPTIPAITLAPNQEVGPILVANDTVNPDIIKDLLAQPSGLVFKVLTFDLINDAGQNYAFLTQTNLNRTAGVTIDYGNGTVEKHRVATNVRLNPNATPAGVTMKEVLTKYLRTDSQVGVAYAVGTNSVTHRQVLTSVKGVTTGVGGPRRFWFVAGTSDRQTNPTNDFETIVLLPGDQIYLIFARDDDDDKLLDREEMLYGSSDSLVDTDGDGLSDFFEIRTGWLVNAPVPGYPKKVYPDARFTDSDGDGWSDTMEFSKLTDPRVGDTDQDGILDAIDSDPLVRTNTPPTFGASTATVTNSTAYLGGNVTDKEDNLLSVVVSWGDGTPNSTVLPVTGATNFVFNTNHTYTAGGTFSILSIATDARGMTRTNTNSVTITVFPTSGLRVEYLFNGNTLDTSGNILNATIGKSAYTVATTDRSNRVAQAYDFNASGYNDEDYGSMQIPALNTASSFTYSAWVNHEPNNGPGIRAIVGQDVTPALFIQDNRVKFGIPNGTVYVTDTSNIAANTWNHYTLTASFTSPNTDFRLYRNGTLVTNRTMSVTIANPNPSANSRLGVYSSALNNPDKNTAFFGKIDNVRIYNRGLSAPEAAELYRDTR